MKSLTNCWAFSSWGRRSVGTAGPPGGSRLQSEFLYINRKLCSCVSNVCNDVRCSLIDDVTVSNLIYFHAFPPNISQPWVFTASCDCRCRFTTSDRFPPRTTSGTMLRWTTSSPSPSTGVPPSRWTMRFCSPAAFSGQELKFTSQRQTGCKIIEGQNRRSFCRNRLNAETRSCFTVTDRTWTRRTTHNPNLHW